MREKLIAVAKGAAVAAVGAGLTYISGWLSGADVVALFGVYGPAIAAAVAVAVNAARKALEPVAAEAPSEDGK